MTPWEWIVTISRFFVLPTPKNVCKRVPKKFFFLFSWGLPDSTMWISLYYPGRFKLASKAPILTWFVACCAMQASILKQFAALYQNVHCVTPVWRHFGGRVGSRSEANGALSDILLVLGSPHSLWPASRAHRAFTQNFGSQSILLLPFFLSFLSTSQASWDKKSYCHGINANRLTFRETHCTCIGSYAPKSPSKSPHCQRVLKKDARERC